MDPSTGIIFTPNYYSDPPRRKIKWGWIIAALLLAGIISVAIYFGVAYNKNSSNDTTIVKPIFNEGDLNWKYTDNEEDVDCLNNWNYYDKDGKTLFSSNISSTTKLNKDKSWCATKRPIYQEEQLNWKYTTDKDDLDCLRNWDYYDTDRKTLIESEISTITKKNKTDPWCATKADTKNPIDRVRPDNRSYFEKNSGKILAGLTGAVALDTLIDQLRAKETSTKPKADETPTKPKADETPTKPKADEPSTKPKADEPSTKPKADEPSTKPKADETPTKPKTDTPSTKPKTDTPSTKPVTETADDAATTLSKKLSSARTAFKKRLIELTPTKFAPFLRLRARAMRLASVSKTLAKDGAKSVVMLTVALATLDTATLKSIGKNMSKSAAKVGKSAGNLVKSLRPGPSILFDIFSLALDAADVGGYGKMQTKAGLYATKSETDKEFKKTMYEIYRDAFNTLGKKLEPEDFVWPLVYDPLEEQDDDELLVKIKLKLLDLFSTIDTSNPDPLIKPCIDAINKDISSKTITEADLTKDDVIQKYYELMDHKAVLNKVNNEWCTSLGGIVYSRKNPSTNEMEDKCTLPKEACNNSYSWPLGPDDVYKEFQDGKCIIANPTMRQMCEDKDAKLPEYDVTTGICKINREYCTKMGAAYEFNKDLKSENDDGYDCNISTGQEVVEFIFGTTITRSLMKGIIAASDFIADANNNGVQSAIDHVILDAGYSAADAWISSHAKKYKSGPVKINGKCIGVQQNGKYPKLQLQDCNSSSNQKFTYVYTPRDDTNLFSFDSGLLKFDGALDNGLNNDDSYCWELPCGNTSDGTNIYLNKCKYGGDKQNFIYDDSAKKIKHRPTQRCITYDDNGFLQIVGCGNNKSVQITPYYT